MEDTADGSARYLPHAIAATAAMTLAPAAAVWGLALSGVATAFIPLLAVGLVVSLLVAYGGRVVWQMLPGSRDLLFSDLMLWGWLRRWRLEKHLRDAGALLGLNARAVLERSDGLDPETRTKALKKLVTAVEARDPYTHGHSRRVARYSTMIAKKLGIPASDVARIRLAATLHDVGKLVVPPTVLNKPGRLNEVELALIKRHALAGADMVSPLGDDELTRMVAHHHERLDGTGYPSQLSGGQIPLGALIIAVADTFDALTSNRVYKPAKRHRDAFWILDEEMGTQFDPVVVQAFRSCYSGFRGIAAWSIVTGAPQRVLLPLASQAPIAGGTLSAKTVAVLAAAAATVSGPSPNDPRDTSASPSAVPALAAVGVAAQSVVPPSPAGRGAESPARDHRQGESQSNGRRGGRAGDDGAGGDRPGQGGGPSPGGEHVPGPGNPPGRDAPPVPGHPGGTVGQLVTERLERLREQPGHLQGQSVRPPEPPGHLVEHPGSPRVAANGPQSRPTRAPGPRPPRKP